MCTSIGLQAVRHPRIRKKVLADITNDIQKEMTKLCAKKTCSLLRQSSVTPISKFLWEALAEELERVSPTMYTILKGCVSAKRRQRNSPETTQQQKHPSDTATLGVCACILLWHKNVHMNTFQHIISLVLHSGHSAKQVYTCTLVHKLFMFGLWNLPISMFALSVHRCIGGFRRCCCVCPITAPLHTWTVLGQSMMLLFCNGVQTLKIL